MRVLLVSPNREHLPDPVFPLGLAYIAASLRSRGHEVRTLDLCFSGQAEDDVRTVVADFRPEVIGVSLRNVDDVSFPKKHSYLGEYGEAVRLLRTYCSAPIVLGGSGFTIMPEQFMHELAADYGIIGEGEKTFLRVIDAIREGRLNPALPLSKRIFHSTPRIGDLDAVSPDREGFDTEGYYRLGGMLNVQTKRGCPFRCIYCTYPRIEGRRVRIRRPSVVADEIERVVERTGARHFFFVDSVFNYPIRHAEDDCRELIDRRLDIRWSCYGQPKYMTPALAEVMAKAGCTGVEFGVDSLVESCMEKLGKNFGLDAVRRALAACSNTGIRTCLFVFAGSPGEDYDVARRNLDLLGSLQPDAAVVMAGIRIFPGTALAELARSEQGIESPGLDPVFYISEGVIDHLERLRKRVERHGTWVMPGYGKNIHLRLQRRLRERGIKGSLWEELAKR